MFRQSCIAAFVAIAALGSIALVIVVNGCGKHAPAGEDPAVAKERQTTEAKHLGVPVEITNSVGMKLIYCPSGSFMMGSPAGEGGCETCEAQVSVTISKGFYLGKYSVAQAEFKAVMGTTPWAGKPGVKEGDDYPATYVDWNDAAEFCRKLTTRESQAVRLPQGYVYALPTEAQREYACRAGTTTRYSYGDNNGDLGDYAWWGGIVGDAPGIPGAGNAKTEQYAHRVGQKKPNGWGLYDMHGNVWEWCRDAYAKKLPGGTDPRVESGSDRVARGGCWALGAMFSRSASRAKYSPEYSSSGEGFRVSLVPADL